jgi:hypothetical protein
MSNFLRPSATLLFTSLAAIVIIAVASTVRPASAATATAGTGGTISIGATSLVGGKINVPIVTTKPTDPYTAAHAHLTFDSALLSAAPADFTRGAILTITGNPVDCGASVTDGGAGITGQCTIIGPFSLVNAAGTLVNIGLSPTGAPGCASLKLWTLNGPDAGDASTGTYTVNSSGGAPQASSYGLTAAFVDTATGRPCTPATPTATPTNTPTATNSPQPTDTATPVPTFTPTSTATPVPPGPSVACLTRRQKVELIQQIWRHFGVRKHHHSYDARLDVNQDGVVDHRDALAVLRTPTCGSHSRRR